MRKAALILLLGNLLAGCSDRGSEPREESVSARETGPEQRTVRGVLRHYPSDVRSVQAWYGHQFLVGDTPVIATEAVPEEALREFIGTEVIVTGTWHAGETWNPTEEEANLSRPVVPDGEGVVRGDGIQATSIRPAPGE